MSNLREIFVDTSAFIALIDSRDAYHQRAVAMEQKLATKGAHLVTTNFVLDETYTGLLGRVRHNVIVQFGQAVRRSQRITVIGVNQAIEDAAWDIFVRYEDKGFSYTDCTSFAVMQQLGLDTVFAFDRHFEQFGFTCIPAVNDDLGG
ncbi:MAG: PIN domain-containing protein [Anaerolineae bacterium]|nr:PIN domain-containing protein [Anaerolineae bacterium]MDH7473160.1 PIN domain-containing protein [Anaerolineae bacterium]